MKKNIFFLLGPTCSGKSKLSLRLASKHPFEIINADIFSFYKGLEIGTAKPNVNDLSKVKHYLIDILSPNENYNVFKFYNDVIESISTVYSHNKIPLIVGGSMMYVYQLLNGISIFHTFDETDNNLINYVFEKYSHSEIYDSLKNYDSNLLANVNKNDSYRIEKIIERVIREKDNNLLIGLKEVNDYNIIILYMDIKDRNFLKNQISIRSKKMLSDGFIDEVQSLMTDYNLTVSNQSMKAIGYIDCIAFINKQISYEDLLNRIITSTNQLAKKQITWKKKFDIQYLIDYPNFEYSELDNFIKNNL